MLNLVPMDLQHELFLSAGVPFCPEEDDMDEAPNRQVLLIFGEIDDLKHVDDPLHKDVSAAVRVGDALFTCCDETAGVDRLTPDGDAWGNHVHI